MRSMDDNAAAGLLIKDNNLKNNIHVLRKWCGKVAGDPDHYTKERATKAGRFLKEYEEWSALPESSLKEREKKNAKKLSLQKRMVSFRRTTE